MPRDNTIKIYRSTGSNLPPSFLSQSETGPTFGELAFVDGLTSLYMGRANGSVVWIGAEVTGGDIEQGLEYAVPTMKSIKTYVDSQVIKVSSGYFIVRGEDGLTHEIALTDTLTLTGGLGIDVVKGSDDDTIIFRGVTATTTAYGVVKINPSGALTHDSSGLNIITDTTLWRLRDEKGVIDDIGYNNILTITGGVGVDFVRTGTDTFAVQGITATTSTLGVASFNPTDFSLSNGAVSLTSGALFFVGTDLLHSSYPVPFGKKLEFKNQNGAITTVVNGPGPSSETFVTIDVALASTSVTGVARFNSGDFTVTNGEVALLPAATAFQIRDSSGLTDAISGKNQILTITGGQGIFTVRSTTDTIAVRGITATTTGTLGVAAFNSPDFTISSGVVSLGTARDYFTVQDEVGQTFGLRIGDTLNITGGRGVDVLRTSVAGVQTTDILAIQGATATATTLGVASFPTTYFTVLDGVVNLATAYQVTGDTVIGPNASLKITTSGRTVTLDNRFATTSLTGVASFDPRYFDTGTTGHVKIVMVDGGTFT